MLVHYFQELGATLMVASAITIAAACGILIVWHRARKKKKNLAQAKRRIELLKDQARQAARSKNEEIRKGVPLLIRLLHRTAERADIELSANAKRELDRIAYMASPAYRASPREMPLSWHDGQPALPMTPRLPGRPLGELELEVETDSKDEPLEIERVLETPIYQPTESIEHRMLSLPEESPSSKEIAWFIQQELVGSDDGNPEGMGTSTSADPTSSGLVQIGSRSLYDLSDFQPANADPEPKKKT